MHMESIWLLIVSGLASMALLIYGGIMEVRKNQRLRKMILRRLEYQTKEVGLQGR